jgi:hypothetical protein
LTRQDQEACCGEEVQDHRTNLRPTATLPKCPVESLLGLRRLDEDENRLAALLRCFEGGLRIGLNRRGTRGASGSDACCQRKARENGQLFHAPSQSG